MSTNYYLHTEAPDPCVTCGVTPGPEQLHIGKSAGGWVFLWHGYSTETVAITPGHLLVRNSDDMDLTSHREWYEFLAARTASGSVIKDEYGKTWVLAEFIGFVAACRLNRRRHSEGEFNAHRVGTLGPDDIGYHEFS